MNDALMNDQYSLNIPIQSNNTNEAGCVRKNAFWVLIVVILMGITGVVVAVVLGQPGKIIQTPEVPFAALPPIPADIVFSGHSHCDMDSLGAAIGAAALFGGTVSMCTDGLNPETQFVFDKFGLAPPQMSNSTDFVGRHWGLVDVSSRSQLPPGVVDTEVVVIVDHHNLAEDNVATAGPIRGDWRPWGSASTIITYRFFESRVAIPNTTVASILLAAIVSDTLNLKSSTTTQYDKSALGYLSGFTHMSKTDVADLARQMFYAKSDVSNLTAEEVVRLDYKKYLMGDAKGENYTAIKVGWAAAETIRTDEYRRDKEKYFEGMRRVREEDKLDLIFMGPVNLETFDSFLFLCDSHESQVAARAFNGSLLEAGVMDTRPLVSRKADFIPKLQLYLNQFTSFQEIPFS